MNGGKDIKIGHDKRPVSIVPSDEQPLYNIQNGEILTDEFGNPLITKVDQFFLADASMDRSTSVVFPENPTDKYLIKKVNQVGVITATYGVDFDVDVLIRNDLANKHMLFRHQIDPVTGNQTGSGLQGVSIGLTALTASGVEVTISDGNQFEVRTVGVNTGSIKHSNVTYNFHHDKNNLYFSNPSDIQNIGVGVSFKVLGHNIPDGSYVMKKDYDRIKISKPVIAGVTTDKVTFSNTKEIFYKADNVLKIAEIFNETSEVSSTLLGVNRAETQLSLFSNVSSYGLNNDEWESYSYNTGSSKSSWDQRANRIYGNRYLARIEEETQESAIKLSAFPPSHSYPFGPEYQKLGLYNKTLHDQYVNFILLGNFAFQLYKQKLSGYSASWISKFLNPADVSYDASIGEIVYSKIPGKENDFSQAFQKIDEWTDTWRAIGEGKSLFDDVQGDFLSFGSLKTLLAENNLISQYDGSNTRPGYNTNFRRYSAIQSRRVFRYQPGRISGFTFGLRASTEPVSGIALEWGIANETDQYVFKIYAGQLSIVRRSTVKLSDAVLVRNGLDPAETLSVQINGTSYNTVQPFITSGDPFDVNDDQGPTSGSNDDGRARKYFTVEIPRDKFNGDPLNGNGPSGYTIRPEKVTMWKIEFGWYGAIGARFYAYIPAGNGDARWVVVHTLVIENSLTGPCLEDSYFRFKYSLDVFNTSNLKTPQFLYKYGASYYIDGGDEGTSQVYSVSTGLSPKQITSASETSLFGIRPKDFFESIKTLSSGEDQIREIVNRKLILPTKFNITTNTLTEVKVKNCRACAGFGHVFTPGVSNGDNGRNISVEFTGTNLITAQGSDYFIEADVGAKLIAPSLFGVYITEIDKETLIGGTYNGPPRYESAKVYGLGDGLDAYFRSGTRESGYNKTTGASARPIGGTKVIDYANGGVEATIPVGVGNVYPHAVRLSNYDVHFASDLQLTGSEIDIQFINPINRDQSSLGGSSTHFADFMIGVTDKRPSINQSNPNLLDGWDNTVVPWTDYTNGGDGVVGVGKTSVLPENEILFGESTHSFVNMNEDGIETGEAFSGGDFRCRMGQDVRIPSVGGTSGGACSLVKIKVSNAVTIASLVRQESLTGTLPGGISTTTTTERHFLSVDGSFGGDITDWLNGRVVFENDDGSANESLATYAQRQPTNYENANNLPSQYIEINLNNNTFPFKNTTISILGRPVQLKASRLGVSTKNKLFRFNPYPLYLVGKLMDKARINNISIKEKSGTFQKTTAPVLSVTNGSNGAIDLANDGSANNTFNDSTPPTNFLEIDKLSSAIVDTQNQQIIRPSTTKDIFYIGENKTEEVDMTKVFGVDRNVITPDNNNVEATFFTAKQLGTGSSKFVQGSLNYKEQ